MVFSKKWLRNHQKFLLHFQIHIDVLMLCRKFEPIPSSNFQVMSILKIEPFSENFPVLMLCGKFELIPTSIFQVMAILKIEPFSENFPVL